VDPRGLLQVLGVDTGERPRACECADLSRVSMIQNKERGKTDLFLEGADFSGGGGDLDKVLEKLAAGLLL